MEYPPFFLLLQYHLKTAMINVAPLVQINFTTKELQATQLLDLNPVNIAISGGGACRRCVEECPDG